MKKIIFAAFIAALGAMSVFAHEAFTLKSSEKITVTQAQIAELQKQATVGKIDGLTLTFTEKEIKLVVTTGPEDDMLSYRIQGLRNPTIVAPTDAKFTLWFVNTDTDMTHDVRFIHNPGDFVARPDIKGTIGTTKLTEREDETKPFFGEKIVFESLEDGRFKYFCSVGAHAKGGMWGNILIGVKPGKNLKMPEKTTHGGHSHGGETPASPTPSPSAGGHQQHTTTDPSPTPHDHAATGTTQPTSTAHTTHGSTDMPAVYNLGDPMHRESSGTAWAPDSSPMYAKMRMTKDGGMWMFMGTAFLRYTDIGSKRDVSVAGEGGRSRVDAPTMFMAMYSHPIGKKAQFGLRTMLSLDPVIERGYGYPLLYQSGELYKGQPIHDRQHPHDLVSELALSFSYKVNEKQSFYIYGGIPAEPALGPPMYLHRASGMNNPDAPIGHHWQDATHITYGVITAGYSFGKFKFDASAFNGTEPDENRWNFDKPRLNSFSGRFSINPTKNWAFQISHGYLRNPERAEPEIRILRRTTASATYNKQFDENRNFAGTFVWGQNYANEERTNSVLFEANYDFFKNAVFGRYETVQKSGHELVLPHPLDHDVFNVSKFSVGYVRDIVQGKGIDVGLGGMVTAGFNPPALAPVYGGTSHAGWQLFLRFRPSKVK